MEVRVTYQVYLLLALLASLSVSITSSQGEEKGSKKVLCVKPDVNPSSTDSDCHHLSYYMVNSSQYFQNNTIFQFQAGIHHLTGDLTVSDVHGLELIGEAGEYNKSSSQIHCSSPHTGNMVFVNVQNLNVSHLLFSNCGGPFNMTEELMDSHATLALLECQNVNILHTVIQNGTGIGLFGYNVHGNSLVNNSAMQFNKGNYARDGGNIFFVYSHSNLNTLTELMIENTLVYGGSSDIFWVVTSPSGLTLAVNQSSNISITVRGCNITRNTAHSGWGGNVQLALISNMNPNVTITIENTIITYGTCSRFGGGMYIYSSISPQTSPPVVNITGCVFLGNNGSHGGALYMYGNPPIVHVYNTTFENNTASYIGGAIYLDVIDTKYDNKFLMGEAIFHNNRATYGGAIGLSLASIINFMKNTATYFTSNSASQNGGAIYVTPLHQFSNCFVVPNHYHHNFFYFSGNRAHSGNNVYIEIGQSLNCQIVGVTLYYSNLNNTKDNSSLTSGTSNVYLCRDGKPHHTHKN